VIKIEIIIENMYKVVNNVFATRHHHWVLMVQLMLK